MLDLVLAYLLYILLAISENIANSKIFVSQKLYVRQKIKRKPQRFYNNVNDINQFKEIFLSQKWGKKEGIKKSHAGVYNDVNDCLENYIKSKKYS